MKTRGAAIEEIGELKLKMYSFLVGNIEHKKAKSVKKNVVATISHDENKDSSTKFHCFDLMTKYISKTMDMMD